MVRNTYLRFLSHQKEFSHCLEGFFQPLFRRVGRYEAELQHFSKAETEKSPPKGMAGRLSTLLPTPFDRACLAAKTEEFGPSTLTHRNQQLCKPHLIQLIQHMQTCCADVTPLSPSLHYIGCRVPYPVPLLLGAVISPQT